MQRTLVGYVRALRAAGARTSVAESLDAARAVEVVGYADRVLLKHALGTTLAKSATDLALHEALFERYFADPTAAAADEPAQTAARADTAAADADDGPAEARTARPDGAQRGADTPLTAQQQALARLLALAEGGRARHGGAGGEATDVEPAGGPAQPAALDLALARAAEAVGSDDIRFATQVPYYTQRLLEQLGIEALQQRITTLQLAAERAQAQGGPVDAGDAAELQRLLAVRALLRRRARAVIDRRFELLGRPATEAFMTDVVVQRPLGRMSPADMARMKAAVQHMARRLAVKHGQRRRRKLRGRIDIRRTLRASAGTEGVPFKLFLRHKRKDKPKIVAVCDVSGSVASHVRLLLLFLYALRGEVTDLRCFAFSDRLKDIDPPLQNLPFDDAMAAVLKELGSGSTDYGRAFTDLEQLHGDAIERRTTLLILGDARSNHADPRADLLAGFAARAKRVVWLNPEPRARWGSGDSEMLKLLPWCSHVAHCANARDVERAIDQALLAYV